MPDHLHAVFELRSTSLASLMHSLKSFSAKRVNAIEGRSGPVWQRQYHETALRDASAIRKAVRYCVLNPTRTGMAATPGEYPFCFCIFALDTL